MFLVGDIGGTHTRLAIFQDRKIEKEEAFPSKEFSNLSDIVLSFLPKNKKIEKAAFGVAGPVQNGHCQTTNLPWILDAKEIEKKTNIPKVFLLNDLEANAYGIQSLQEKELVTLRKAEKEVPGNRALVSAGTGLGEAGLFWDGKQHHPFASEGGHADFAARNEREFLLFQFLQKKYGHVSYERIASGPGIEELFSFVVKIEKKSPLFSGEVNAKKISEEAVSGKCPVCKEVLEWFVSFYAAEAANACLKYLALGGLYLGGGIAPKILPILQHKIFHEAFLDKGRFEKVLRNITVKVILNEKTALLGALRYVLRKS